MFDLNITENNTTFDYEVTGLEKFTNYSVRVKAFTSVGASTEATSSVTTTEDSKFLIGLCVYMKDNTIFKYSHFSKYIL